MALVQQTCENERQKSSYKVYDKHGGNFQGGSNEFLSYYVIKFWLIGFAWTDFALLLLASKLYGLCGPFRMT